MTWFKVDDGFWRHRKVRRLGADRVAAAGLWVLAGNWSADQGEDGFVPAEQVEFWDPERTLAARLVEVGLWHETARDGEPGYLFHQWEERQPLAADIEEQRAEWRERKKAQRAAKKTSPSAPAEVSPGTSPGTGGGTSGGSPGDVRNHSRPVPSRSSPDGEERDSLRSSPPAQRRPSAAELDRTAHSDHARSLVEAYAATCTARPSATVRRRLGPGVDELIAEGWPDELISGALAFWRDKGLDPAVFPSVANEFANRSTRPPAAVPKQSTTDQRVADAQALKARYADDPRNQRTGPAQIGAAT
jgi:hypothetical protein